MKIRTKRVYEAASAADGVRVLIDRIWPRGVSKDAAGVDYWARDVAPSKALRVWYAHDPEKWDEFRARYFAELDENPEGVAELIARIDGRDVTLVFSSREEALNNATAMKQYLEARPSGRAT